jgi:hypothetical protein
MMAKRKHLDAFIVVGNGFLHAEGVTVEDTLESLDPSGDDDEMTLYKRVGRVIVYPRTFDVEED